MQYIYIFDRLSSLFQEANFVLSCCPLQNGRNEIVINTVKASTSKVRDFLFFKFIQFYVLMYVLIMMFSHFLT